MNNLVHILYVDDNPHDRELVRHVLEKESNNFKLSVAGNKEEFEHMLAQNSYDLVLSDFDISGFEGLQVIELVKAAVPHIYLQCLDRDRRRGAGYPRAPGDRYDRPHDRAAGAGERRRRLLRLGSALPRPGEAHRVPPARAPGLPAANPDGR